MSELRDIALDGAVTEKRSDVSATLAPALRLPETNSTTRSPSSNSDSVSSNNRKTDVPKPNAQKQGGKEQGGQDKRRDEQQPAEQTDHHAKPRKAPDYRDEKTGKQKVPRCDSWMCVINNPRKIFGEKGNKMTPEEIVDEIGRIVSGTKNKRNVLVNFEKGLNAGTEHCHMCVESDEYIRASTLDRLFPARSPDGKPLKDADGNKLFWLFDHEFTKGSGEQVEDYMWKRGVSANKEETLVVAPKLFGKTPIIGKVGSGNKPKADIQRAALLIQSGMTPSDVYLKDPRYLSIASQLEQYYQIWKRENQPTRWNMEVIWCIGYSGTRKSSYLEEVERKYGRNNVYMVANIAENPWDGYNGEKVVFIDEFRDNQIKFAELLELLIGLRGELGARYRNRTKCFDTVYITSIKFPFELFKREIDELDDMTQLTRRITTYLYFWRSIDGSYHHHEFPASVATTRTSMEADVFAIDEQAVFEPFTEATWEEHLAAKANIEANMASSRERRAAEQAERAAANVRALFGGTHDYTSIVSGASIPPIGNVSPGQMVTPLQGGNDVKSPVSAAPEDDGWMDAVAESGYGYEFEDSFFDDYPDCFE